MKIKSKNIISVNIIFSVLQVFLSGIIYLILYKYLLTQLGIKKLGVWSIIIATSSIVNIASVGLSSSLVKFVADYHSSERTKEISKLIFTTFIFIFILFLLLTLFIYLLGTFLLKIIIEPEFLDISIKILPLSLLCLIINSLGGVFLAALEGFQKNYIKNIILIITTLLFLLITIFLVPEYDLFGVVYAQLIQAFLILIFSFIFLNKTHSYSIFNRWNWNNKIFKEIFNYGLKFQLITVLVVFLEPITKSLLSFYGGLSTLGFYEMASKLVYQIRAIIINANQVMIPVIVKINNTEKEKLNSIYEKSLNITFFMDVVILIGMLYFGPLISILWIGSNNFIFNLSLLILIISMFINILNGPSYFTYMAKGKLNQILYSHIIIAFLNVVLGIFFGKIFGGVAVIFTTGISLIFGSVYLIYNYHSRNKINFINSIEKNSLIFLLVNIVTGLFSNFYTILLIEKTNIYWAFFIVLLLFFIVLLYFTSNNKHLKKILIKIKN